MFIPELFKTRKGLNEGAIPQQYISSSTNQPQQCIHSVQCNEAKTEVMLPANRASASTGDEPPTKVMKISSALTKLPIRKNCETSIKIPVSTSISFPAIKPKRISISTPMSIPIQAPVLLQVSNPSRIAPAHQIAPLQYFRSTQSIPKDSINWKMPASFSVCCSVCNTSEVWSCSACQGKERNSTLKPTNDRDALPKSAKEEPKASASNGPIEFIECDVKPEPLEDEVEASPEVTHFREWSAKTSKPVMRLEEEIRDLEQQLQELRKAKIAASAAEASVATNGSSNPTLTITNTNCAAVRDLPSVKTLHERENDHRNNDGRNTNDRLDFLENNMTKLKDKINDIQLNVKSIQAIVEENNFILKRRDFTKAFPPNVMRSRLAPAQTSDELDQIAHHPEMIQFLSEISECTLSRTVTQMMKSLMSKELAAKYSLTGLSRRREHSKISFKNSPAYQAVEHAVLSSPNYHSLPRKEIFRAITSALKNSADWDGGRTKRISSKQTEWQATDQPDFVPADQAGLLEHTTEHEEKATGVEEEPLDVAAPGLLSPYGREIMMSPLHAECDDMRF
ncbi:hypothetical protein FHG87_010587 [Trinorchestia longiramus]|nr:hypothetical protein FHG87_010587 [Trinorchestia longiramus]